MKKTNIFTVIFLWLIQRCQPNKTKIINLVQTDTKNQNNTILLFTFIYAPYQKRFKKPVLFLSKNSSQKACIK